MMRRIPFSYKPVPLSLSSLCTCPCRSTQRKSLLLPHFSEKYLNLRLVDPKPLSHSRCNWISVNRRVITAVARAESNQIGDDGNSKEHTRCCGIDDTDTLPPLFVCSNCCEEFAEQQKKVLQPKYEFPSAENVFLIELGDDYFGGDERSLGMIFPEENFLLQNPFLDQTLWRNQFFCK
ncbi:unnamed protein product [Arabidopsis halleri]